MNYSTGLLDRGPTLFIMMELLDGKTLLEWMQSQPMRTVRQATRVASQLCSGLLAMHDKGLVHRDLKPANVLVDRSGYRIVITDFGTVHGADATRMTATGEFWGTPAYTAPEQLLGAEPTPATDLYALGVIFFGLLTGIRPHDADSVPTLIQKILSS